MQILKQYHYENDLDFCNKVVKNLKQDNEAWIPFSKLSKFIDFCTRVNVQEKFKVYFCPSLLYCRLHLVDSISQDNDKLEKTQLQFNFETNEAKEKTIS